jgi:hypothetical protein
LPQPVVIGFEFLMATVDLALGEKKIPFSVVGYFDIPTLKNIF